MQKKAFSSVIITLGVLISYTIVSGQDDSLSPVKVDAKYGYADQTGKIIIPPTYLVALPFNTGGIAAVVDDSGWVYINSSGLKLLRPFIVDNGPDYFVDGLARFVKDNKIGFCDQKGRVIISAQFSFVQPFSEGVAGFCTECRQIKEGEYHRFSGGKWGFIDRKGNVIIKAIYEQVKPFNNGVAEVKDKHIWYFINRQGQKI